MKEPLKECPFCHEYPIFEKKPLWTAEGRGYYRCYDISIVCNNSKCLIQPRTKSYNTVYGIEEECFEKACSDWNKR